MVEDTGDMMPYLYWKGTKVLIDSVIFYILPAHSLHHRTPMNVVVMGIL